MTAILTALLGAIAAGLFQILNDMRLRRHEARSILTALQSEVAALCQILDDSGVIRTYAKLASERDRSRFLSLPIHNNFLGTYDALVPVIGKLDRRQASKIVRFYVLAKVMLDSMREDGPFRDSKGGTAAGAHRFLAATGDQLLAIGASITATSA